MGSESNSPAKASSNRWVWIIVAIVLLGALVFCLILLVAGGLYLRPSQSSQASVPESQVAPTGAQTSPVIPAIPTEVSSVETPPVLDYEADPLFGPVNLQRGFSPDPYTIDAEAGGAIDTSELGFACGFTTPDPTFAFNLTGGASETFLRIFFAASDGTDTTLVVYTPDQEWLCTDNSTFGNGIDPVIDIEFAPSGYYAIWIGTQQSNTRGTGSLYITQSTDVAP
jgi:hypothetical protein